MRFPRANAEFIVSVCPWFDLQDCSDGVYRLPILGCDWDYIWNLIDRSGYVVELITCMFLKINIGGVGVSEQGSGNRE
jgi:hypothetical protein